MHANYTVGRVTRRYPSKVDPIVFSPIYKLHNWKCKNTLLRSWINISVLKGVQLIVNMPVLQRFMCESLVLFSQTKRT